MSKQVTKSHVRGAVHMYLVNWGAMLTVYIAEEGMCDIGRLLRQQRVIKGSSALSRAAARCRRQQRVVEGSSVLSRAGTHNVKGTTVVTVTHTSL
jgi:hypothetical protein